MTTNPYSPPDSSFKPKDLDVFKAYVKSKLVDDRFECDLKYKQLGSATYFTILFSQNTLQNRGLTTVNRLLEDLSVMGLIGYEAQDPGNTTAISRLVNSKSLKIDFYLSRPIGDVLETLKLNDPKSLEVAVRNAKSGREI